MQKEDEKSEILFESLIARISGMAEGIFFKFGMWPPLSGRGTSIVNLGPFGSDTIELWMHENRDLVVPVNIHVLPPFVCTPFSWAAQHTTVCLDV